MKKIDNNQILYSMLFAITIFVEKLLIIKKKTAMERGELSARACNINRT